MTALCGDEQLAEDIVADAFVKAWQTLPREVHGFQYWLFRVCKNGWIDHLRRQKRLAPDDRLQTLADPVTPEASYITGQRQQALWQAVRALPDRDRELITAHYFSGLPLQEVAALMGSSYPAVRQRIRRLRQTLRQQMEEQGYEF